MSSFSPTSSTSSMLDSAIPPTAPSESAADDASGPSSTSTDSGPGDMSSGATTAASMSGALGDPTASVAAAPLNAFQQNLIDSGNIIGGVPTSHDTNPSAALFTAYLVFLAILGIRSLFRRTSSSVDFRVFCFLVVRIVTFAMRFGLSQEDATDPEKGTLIGEGVLMLMGPLLLMSPLLTVVVNIATPTLDALKARADVERSVEGGSRRPGGGSQFFLKHLPQVFQVIIGICAVLLAVVAIRFRRALKGEHEAQKEVRHIKAVTSLVLSIITIFTLLIIIVLWAKIISAGKTEYYIGTNGRSRKTKGYKVQAFLATIIAIVTGVFMMYRVIQGHVAIDSRVNKFQLFWCLYVAPETFVALIFVLYCFPALPREEIVIVPGGNLSGSDSDGNSNAAPSMRTVGRNGSITSMSRTSSMGSSIRYNKA
ncbi:hypothetical protein CF326_g6189 [Tilletia indica]|nr:hypothetical protein CF326_g6189 [Tilletia indica]